MNKEKTVIFLDLDGPMSNHRACSFPNEGLHEKFDPVAAQALNNICEKFNAVVVITSTRSMDHSNKNKEHLFNLFSDAGFNTRHIHDDWSATYRGGKKASQIHEYLQRHPDIKKWIMIEDDREIVESIMLVDGYDGMSFSDFLSLENFLESDKLHYNEQTMRIDPKCQLL